MNINSSFSHRTEEPESGVLYLVGTPIGNLSDISSRAINILKNVSFIACEDTRITRKLLNSFKINNKLISFHQHNLSKRMSYLISELKEGKSIALVSDAGMPLISDPGESLVSQVRNNNLDVISIPGPCAAITALVSSGLDTQRFTFYGFLPRKTNEKKIILKSIAENKFSSIIYESPKRLKKLLLDLKLVCGGDRKISIAKELTKKYEFQITSLVDELIEELGQTEPRGEYTIVIEGEKPGRIKDFRNEKIKQELIDLIEAGLRHSAAATYLAKKYEIPKNIVYKLKIID